MADQIKIDLGNGFALTVERNSDPNYDKEIFVGVTNDKGEWWQDLCVVRPVYSYFDDDGNWINEPKWDTSEFEILVYGDKDGEDWTENHMIGLYEDEQRTEFAI